MMKAWQKWTVRVGLLSGFVVTLWGILFFANGYQYDFSSNQIRKTGIIEVSYADAQAQVFLDGGKKNVLLPGALAGILPGDYDLVIGREGYLDYALRVKVKEDLITRIPTAFLYPLDVLAKAKALSEVATVMDGQAWLEDGYMLWRKGNQLYWRVLSSEMKVEDTMEAEVFDAAVKGIQILNNEVLLWYGDGRRQIVNMETGLVEEVLLGANYVWAGDKWVYFEGNLLAVFDRKLTKVYEATYLETGVQLARVSYWRQRNGGAEVIGVEAAGLPVGGRVYVWSGGRLKSLLNERVTDWRSALGRDAYFMRDNELWRWDEMNEKMPELIGRFGEGLTVRAVLEVAESKGILLLSAKDKFYLADQGFDNVREILPGKRVLGVYMGNKSELYIAYWADDGGSVKVVMLEQF